MTGLAAVARRRRRPRPRPPSGWPAAAAAAAAHRETAIAAGRVPAARGAKQRASASAARAGPAREAGPEWSRASWGEFQVRFRPKSRRIQAGTAGVPSGYCPAGLCYAQRNWQRPIAYAMPDALDLLKTRRSVKPIELDRSRRRPRPNSRRCSPSPRACPTTASSRPGASSCSRAMRGSRPATTIAAVFKRQPARRHARPGRVSKRKRLARAPLVIAVVSRAGAACQNSRMGAGAVGRRRRDEPRVRRACAGLCRELAHRMVRL